jgi:hypothetical protein
MNKMNKMNTFLEYFFPIYLSNYSMQQRPATCGGGGSVRGCLGAEEELFADLLGRFYETVTAEFLRVTKI